MEPDVPSPIDLRDAATARAWAAEADARRPWRTQLRTAIADLVRGDSRILELGPGPGLLAETILQTCSVASYTLFDFSPPMLEMCRERIGEHPAAHFILGDFRHDDWPPGPFDAVIAMQAIHEARHKRHAVTLYRHAHSVLRPGGALLVCDHEPPSDDSRHTRLYATAPEQHAAFTAAGFEDIRTVRALHGMYLCAARRPA